VVLGIKPVIVVLKVLLVVLTHTSSWPDWFDLRIQKPRAVMFAPPGLDTDPVTKTVVLVTVPLVNDTVGGGGGGVVGAADMLACGPAPAEFTALTLKLWVVFDNPVKLWVVERPTDVHVPLFRDTSYLNIFAPPVLAGACQFTLTAFVAGVVERFLGAPGTVIFDGVVNVFAPL